MCLNEDCNLGPIESGSSKAAAGGNTEILGKVWLICTC